MIVQVRVLLVLFGLSLCFGHSITRFEIQNATDLRTQETAQINPQKELSLNAAVSDLNEDTTKERMKRRIDYNRPYFENEISGNSINRMVPRNKQKVFTRIPKAAISSHKIPTRSANPNPINNILNQYLTANQKTKRQNPNYPRETFGSSLISLIRGIKRSFKNNIANLISNIFNISSKKDIASTVVPTISTEMTTVRNIEEKVLQVSLDELLRSDVFWNWMSGWTTGYGKILTEHVQNLVKDEVEKQGNKINQYEVPIIKDKDEITSPNTEQDKDKNEEKNTSKNKQPKPINVKVDAVYGNAVDNGHVTNIFLFYPSMNRTMFNKTHTNEDLKENITDSEIINAINSTVESPLTDTITIGNTNKTEVDSIINSTPKDTENQKENTPDITHENQSSVTSETDINNTNNSIINNAEINNIDSTSANNSNSDDIKNIISTEEPLINEFKENSTSNFSGTTTQPTTKISNEVSSTETNTDVTDATEIDVTTSDEVTTDNLTTESSENTDNTESTMDVDTDTTTDDTLTETTFYTEEDTTKIDTSFESPIITDDENKVSTDDVNTMNDVSVE